MCVVRAFEDDGIDARFLPHLKRSPKKTRRINRKTGKEEENTSMAVVVTAR
jgi:hypothetical protein